MRRPVRHRRASNRVRARERSALRAWAAQRAALDSWHRAELHVEELRARTRSGAEAEDDRLETARLARAEQQAAELRRRAEACQIAYRETLDRMEHRASPVHPVQTIAPAERMA